MEPSCSFIAKSFVDVPITDAGVDTPAFLEASEGLLGMFGASVLRSPSLGVNISIESVSNDATWGLDRTRRTLEFHPSPPCPE